MKKQPCFLMEMKMQKFCEGTIADTPVDRYGQDEIYDASKKY